MPTQPLLTDEEIEKAGQAWILAAKAEAAAKKRAYDADLDLRAARKALNQAEDDKRTVRENITIGQIHSWTLKTV